MHAYACEIMIILVDPPRIAYRVMECKKKSQDPAQLQGVVSLVHFHGKARECAFSGSCDAVTAPTLHIEHPDSGKLLPS